MLGINYGLMLCRFGAFFKCYGPHQFLLSHPNPPEYRPHHHIRISPNDWSRMYLLVSDDGGSERLTASRGFWKKVPARVERGSLDSMLNVWPSYRTRERLQISQSCNPTRHVIRWRENPKSSIGPCGPPECRAARTSFDGRNC